MFDYDKTIEPIIKFIKLIYSDVKKSFMYLSQKICYEIKVKSIIKHKDFTKHEIEILEKKINEKNRVIKVHHDNTIRRGKVLGLNEKGIVEKMREDEEFEYYTITDFAWRCLNKHFPTSS